MANKRNIKVSIGTESTPGTKASLQATIPITDLPSLKETVAKFESKVITGETMITGMVPSSVDVGGSLEVSPSVCLGYCKAVKSNLTTIEATPKQVGAVWKVKYTGSANSCKLVATSGIISSYVGNLGAEVLDTAFNTSGTIDTTNASYNTVQKLITTINTYSGYSASLITGDSSLATTNVLTAISGTQAKGRWAIMSNSSASSGTYLHELDTDLGTTERRASTIQIDNIGDNVAYVGSYIDKLSIKGTIKAEITGTLDVVALTTVSGQTASAYTVDAKPLMFNNGSTMIGGTVINYIRNLSINTANNIDGENGYQQGSLYRGKAVKGNFEVTGDLQMELNADSEALLSKVNSIDTVPLYAEFKGELIKTNYYKYMIVDIPYAGLNAPDLTASNDTLDRKIGFKAINDKSNYDNAFSIYFIDNVSSAY